jgi:hypothetical protein
VVSGNIASGQIGWNHIQSGIIVSGYDAVNYIANGGMWFADNSDPVVNTLMVSGGQSGGDQFTANNFRGACSSGSALYYQRWDRLTSGWASGVSSEFYGEWRTGLATSGMFLIYQVISAANIQDLANRPIIYQVRVRQRASGNVFRLGILQTVSGVVADTIPNSIVSGWVVGTSGADPTFGSGVSLLAPAIDIAANDSWQTFSLTVQTTSGGVCLIPAVWLNYLVVSGTSLQATEWGVYRD